MDKRGAKQWPGRWGCNLTDSCTHPFSGASSGSYDWTQTENYSETWRETPLFFLETPLFTERLLCLALHFTFLHYSYGSR